jgi:Flp pilus assembly protein TadD
VLPHAEQNAVAVPEIALDSTGRTLGILATMLGRFEDAERHFERAAAMNERMGARPWMAHTELEHARMLVRRDAGRDRRRAKELLAGAQATYRELGMWDDLVGAEALARKPTPGS